MQGYYISIEGPDGVGKDHARGKMVEWLKLRAERERRELRIFKIGEGIIKDPEKTDPVRTYPEYDHFAHANLVLAEFPSRVACGRLLRWGMEKVGWKLNEITGYFLHEMDEIHKNTIVPALEHGIGVVTVRSMMSTFVYQGMAMHDERTDRTFKSPFTEDNLPVDREVMGKVMAELSDLLLVRHLKLLRPDLTLVLHAPDDVIAQRLGDRDQPLTRNEESGRRERVAALYRYPPLNGIFRHAGTDVRHIDSSQKECVPQLYHILENHFGRKV